MVLETWYKFASFFLKDFYHSFGVQVKYIYGTIVDHTGPYRTLWDNMGP